MREISTKVLIVGGGPGGYVAAIRCGQLGLATVLVEEGQIGGTCLNVGCIPSKAIIHVADAYHQAQAQEHASPFGLTTIGTQLDFSRARNWMGGIVSKLNSGVAFLLRKNKVLVLAGHAEIVDGKTCIVTEASGPTRVRAEHLVIATGADPVEITCLPFGGPVLSSTELLALDRVPKTLAVIGAGYIGLELGTAFAKLGTKVTVIEAADTILPACDRELTQPVTRRLEALGITISLGATARGLRDDGVLLATKRDGETFAAPAEVILVAVGRKARTNELERLELDRNGASIRVDSRCATSMRNVWAIGDVTGEPMLAHRAMAQGELVADLISGKQRIFDHNAIPAICFTDPEIVTVGLGPEEARSSGLAVQVGTFPFAANGRALTQADEIGFVRVVARAEDHIVLGIQAVGSHVSELASAFSLALEMSARIEDIAATIQAHPTRSEGFQEAALSALGHAIHI